MTVLTRKSIRQYLALVAVIALATLGLSLSVVKAKALDKMLRDKGKEEYAEFQRHLISEYCKSKANERYDNVGDLDDSVSTGLACIWILEYMTARANCMMDAMLARELGDDPKDWHICMEEKGQRLH